MKIGERIAEKIDDVIRGKGEIAFYYQSKPRRMEIFAALINQEIAKENTELKAELAYLRLQRDALLDITWLDLPGEPSESIHKLREQFNKGWMRRPETE